MSGSLLWKHIHQNNNNNNNNNNNKSLCRGIVIQNFSRLHIINSLWHPTKIVGEFLVSLKSINLVKAFFSKKYFKITYGQQDCALWNCPWTKEFPMLKNFCQQQPLLLQQQCWLGALPMITYQMISTATYPLIYITFPDFSLLDSPLW